MDGATCSLPKLRDALSITAQSSPLSGMYSATSYILAVP
jgi:hypothetical protein